jgi:fibronectin-binding autotransporter adhesin
LGNPANANPLNVQTGTLQATNTFTLDNGGSNARNIVDTGALTVDVTGANVFTIDGVISGPGGVTKTDTGNLVLDNAETYTGTTAVNGGTLKLDFTAAGAPASNIISSSSALTLGGGTLNMLGAAARHLRARRAR